MVVDSSRKGTRVFVARFFPNEADEAFSSSSSYTPSAEGDYLLRNRDHHYFTRSEVVGLSRDEWSAPPLPEARPSGEAPFGWNPFDHLARCSHFLPRARPASQAVFGAAPSEWSYRCCVLCLNVLPSARYSTRRSSSRRERQR